eukprot:1677040-Prymnesium_polylepis.3
MERERCVLSANDSGAGRRGDGVVRRTEDQGHVSHVSSFLDPVVRSPLRPGLRIFHRAPAATRVARRHRRCLCILVFASLSFTVWSTEHTVCLVMSLRDTLDSRLHWSRALRLRHRSSRQQTDTRMV